MLRGLGIAPLACLLWYAHPFPLAVVGLWFIYRVARGWLALQERRAMYA